jgi:D-alanyl-D-alanine carboxypeptidase/D-alanyl-D-alanine-endopeptidase (penicillin-binding protein 4)
MMRICLRVTAALAMIAAVQTVSAQQNAGCDGPVGNAGRSGACTELARRIAGLLDSPAVARAHWGVAVAGMDGAPIYGWNEGQMFQPASTAKLFTTAAAMALLGPEKTVTTTISANGVLTGKEYLKGNIYIFGDGDANLSGRAVPYAPHTDEAFPPLRYLEDMATGLAQTGLKTVDGDVIGIGSHFADQPYPEGWSVDDLLWGYGAPVSALSINDNQLKVAIAPAQEVSSRATIEITPAVPYYTVANDVMTVAKGERTNIAFERVQGSRQLRVYGRIALGAAPDVEHISIDDPTEFAAIALKQLLEQHGVTVTGRARAEHAMLGTRAASARYPASPSIWQSLKPSLKLSFLARPFVLIRATLLTFRVPLPYSDMSLPPCSKTSY